MNKIDGCIETMLYRNGKVMLLYNHIKRLRKSMKYISGERLDEHQLKHDLLTYIQSIEESEYVIRIQYNRTEPQFIFSKRSMPLRVHTPKVGIAFNHLLPIHPLSWIKKSDRSVYDLAKVFAQDKGWDDIILLNEKGKVCESSIANIFIKKQGVFYTPDLSQGCVAGVYRDRFITECKLKKIQVTEQTISIEDLLQADEILLSNTIRKCYPIHLMPINKSDIIPLPLPSVMQQELGF